MQIQLIAVDVDGTLLRQDQSLSRKTVRAIARAAESGIEVVLSTGRTYQEFSHLLKLLPSVHYAVACTGASVIDCRTREELFCSPMPAQVMREAWARLQEFDLLFEVFTNGMIMIDDQKSAAYYMENSTNPGQDGTRQGKADFEQWIATMTSPISKIHMYFRETAERDRAWDAIRDIDAFVCCSDAFDLELMASGVDKGTGLKQLAQYLNIDHTHIMAVGDSLNDLGMLRYAGHRAVMANGSQILKDLADVITDSNEADGVAKLLDALLAGQLDPSCSEGCLQQHS